MYVFQGEVYGVAIIVKCYELHVDRRMLIESSQMLL